MTAHPAPFRALTAVALCDGHDAAIVAVNRALRREGFEVVYLGFNKGPEAIVRAAVEEDADVIGLSTYNGGHMEFVAELLELLRKAGAPIPVVVGGGGTVTAQDAVELKAMGVRDVFPPGVTLAAIAKMVHGLCKEATPPKPTIDTLLPAVARGDRRAIAQALSDVESPHGGPDRDLDAVAARVPPHDPAPVVVGVCGNGGAGKSTLIDELVLRFVARAGKRVAVVCCDPTGALPGGDGHDVGGALLGDRIRMLAAEHEGVFIRSLATRKHPGGVSGSLARAVRVLSAAPFDVIILESAGIGQADNPFAGLVDINLYVMTSEFGSALQLEKTVMLEQADIVVLNKFDQPAAPAALRQVQQRLRAEKRAAGKSAEALGACAVRHKDPGMDAVFEAVEKRMGAGVG